MVIRDRHLRHQKLMLEPAEPPASAQTANHSAVANEKPINKLFYGAQKQLISVQDMLHQLVMILQEDYKEVDASGVSSVYGAVAKSVNEMNRLAKTWRDEAAKADEKRQSASASGMQMAGFRRDGDLFTESTPDLLDIQRHTSFEFDRFLPAMGEDE